MLNAKPIFGPVHHMAIVAILSLAVVGCASTPTPLQGDYAQPSVETMRSSATGLGIVRAGGEIIGTEPGRNSTCFEILQRPLDRRARPIEQHDGGDRFLACRNGFYDPAVFEPGREITVLGRFDQLVEREIGEYLYTFPQLQAEVVYLWPIRREPRQDSFYHFGASFGYPLFYLPYRSRFGVGWHYRTPLKNGSDQPQDSKRAPSGASEETQ